MRDDHLVDRVVGLDEVAAVLADQTVGWRSAGLEVGQVTWRDAEASWPQPLETDRARVQDPDSVGVVISGPGEVELSVVLFRGGWADVDFVASLADAGSLPASGIASPTDFEGRMNQWVARVFGVCGGAE
jgi:predicted NBD/HSP70 family sugar kinase